MIPISIWTNANTVCFSLKLFSSTYGTFLSSYIRFKPIELANLLKFMLIKKILQTAEGLILPQENLGA